MTFVVVLFKVFDDDAVTVSGGSLPLLVRERIVVAFCVAVIDSSLLINHQRQRISMSVFFYELVSGEVVIHDCMFQFHDFRCRFCLTFCDDLCRFDLF